MLRDFLSIGVFVEAVLIPLVMLAIMVGVWTILWEVLP